MLRALIAKTLACRAAKSVCFVRFLLYSGLIRNPVNFPGLAAIIRECLFEVWLTRVGVQPKKANQNGSAVQRILGVKLAAAVPELPDLGYDQGAVLGIGPIEPPLAGLRMVESEGQTLDVARNRTIGFELFQLSAAIPDFAGD